MKAAHALRAYKNPGDFEAPEGVVTAELDPDTGELATYACPRREKEVFIAGSQPTTFCRFHGSGGQLALATNADGWDSAEAESGAQPAPTRQAKRGSRPRRVKSPHRRSKPTRKAISDAFGHLQVVTKRPFADRPLGYPAAKC
jgi:hypothetical protein